MPPWMWLVPGTAVPGWAAFASVRRRFGHGRRRVPPAAGPETRSAGHDASGPAAISAADAEREEGRSRRSVPDRKYAAAPFSLRSGSFRTLRNEPDRPATSAAGAGAGSGTPLSGQPLFDVLDMLPHPLLALDGLGMLLHANRMATEGLGDALAALLRHPALNDALRAAPPGSIGEIQVPMDVPVRRVLQVAFRRAASDLVLLGITDHTAQQALERTRADFAAYASHELRTPLASLIGFIETLRGPAADDPAAQQRFLPIMAEQAARMRRLIDSLLSLSRAEFTERQKPRQRVAVRPLLRAALDGAAPEAILAGAELVLEAADLLPDVAGDADQLAQVLRNLLENALKYGVRPGTTNRIVLSAAPAAPSWLGSRTEAEPSPPSWLLIAVTDGGEGIAAHHLPRLTERFYRAEQVQGRLPGSGLGLAIVKHVVARHGGRLLLSSEPGNGLRAEIWLPVGG
ncbi:sensor histidine kinase [Rhizosaccharibacter radicis]|uniref:histidine kinase n=1 Tax=Rhizosaccharibacter radicis TaxID=2782605 RepID=A0ABT1VUN6_9PROT|nr:HAMP domain-containing histidine kinase [Acetobacteraceae bacterium KSS12]